MVLSRALLAGTPNLTGECFWVGSLEHVKSVNSPSQPRLPGPARKGWRRRRRRRRRRTGEGGGEVREQSLVSKSREMRKGRM